MFSKVYGAKITFSDMKGLYTITFSHNITKNVILQNIGDKKRKVHKQISFR